MRTNWTLRIYRDDKRCRTGERLLGRYEYYDKTEDDMGAEIMDLCRMYPPDKYRIELLHRRDWLLTIEEMTGVDGRGRKSHGQHKYFNKDTYEMMQVAGLFRKMYQSDMILIDYNQI